MGALLHLQHSSAGLGAPANAFESFLLERLIFGASKREAEDASFHRPDLWKYSVSGDNPIVLARVEKGTEEELRRLSVMIGLFKYLCIRGIRYDFLILFIETDAYARTVCDGILSEIRRAGCENFISWRCGIYLLEENLLTEREKSSFTLAASADFLLSRTLTDTMRGMEEPVLPEKTELLLKEKTEKTVLPAPMPQIRTIRKTESGYFHDEGFLVKKPHGKAPFAHVLASRNFGTVLTENSLGFTFARNAGMQKLTPHTADGFREDVGERLILRRRDTFGDKCFCDYDLCASAAWSDFGFGYASYYGKIGGVSYEVRVEAVGMHDLKKIEVTLENANGEIPVMLAYTVLPCLGVSRLPARFYQYRKEEMGVRIRTADADKKFFGAAVFSPDADAVYTNEVAFRTDGAAFDGGDDIAAVCVRRKISGKERVTFYLGAYFSEKQYLFLQKLASEDTPCEGRIWKERFARLAIRSRHPCFDETVNHWSLYQTLASRIYARSGFYQVSGAYGFRDQLQDALALIAVEPREAKILILRAAAHQYEEGDVQHWWHPTERAGIRTRCSDDLLWLPYVTAEYVRQTGDSSIVDISVPYLHSAPLATEEQERYERTAWGALREPLFSHLLRAVAYGRQYGPHGLPLIGSCDWNDGMNLVGAGGRGESVWLAFFRILVLRQMRSLCETVGETAEISELENEEKRLYGAVEKHGYDEKWYRRGYYDDGAVLGGRERGDCKIDILPQAFSAIVARESGFAEARAREAMASAEKRLYDKKHALFRLLFPPFDRDAQSPGYIKGYVPGIRENGGQYTHAAVWAALGFFMIGDVAKGTEILFAINPAERYLNPDVAKAYRIEPYVFAGDVYANPQHVGRGGWSFYTGSAAWYRKVALEVLCGYTEEGDGFRLKPLLSDAFNSFSLTVNKRGTYYRIAVSPSDVFSLVLDGKMVSDGENHFFLFDGEAHEAELKFPRP
jgi:cyclic beta-1,2-glucan synthetase